MGGFRCYICDYSPDTPSLYHQGLATGHSRRNMVALPDGDFICQLCYDNGFDKEDDFPMIDEEFDEP